MTTAKKLTLKDVTWTLEVEQEEVEVRGNALASGDDEQDRECEDEILERLDSGDVWAWAAVTVRGEFKGLTAETYLGCCSYEDEKEFTHPSGYYPQMQAEVLADLQNQLEDVIAFGVGGEQE